MVINYPYKRQSVMTTAENTTNYNTVHYIYCRHVARKYVTIIIYYYYY
jgi:hypothetical protein